MLQVKNLTLVHKKDLRKIIENFSCVLNKGDKAVLIGEEGNGKSTVLKWIYDSAMIEDYCEAEGELVAGALKMGYLPQELRAEDKKKTLYDYFSERDVFYDKSPKELSRLALETGLPTDIYYSNQLLESLSGGEKVKVQMIRMLIEEPDVLLLDEPSNDIDIETLEWLERLIQQWPNIVLYISHDEKLIEETANMIIHLEQLRRKTICRYTIAPVSYGEYRKQREDAFERQARLAAKDIREKEEREARYQKIYQQVEQAQNAITRQNPSGGRLLKKKMHAIKAMGRRFEREDAEMTRKPEQEGAIYFELGNGALPVANGKGILAYYKDILYTPDGEHVLSRDISLKIRGPEKICIIGKNGVGKTTLLKDIAGQLLTRKDIKVEYMPQNYEDLLNMDCTPVDYLDTTGDKAERTRIQTYLGALKYTMDEMSHPIGELSGGQKAKVLLLKLSLSGANVLILDEPTRNFSPLSGPVIRRMIEDFPGAVISISHDRKYIEEVCEKVYELTDTGLEEKRHEI